MKLKKLKKPIIIIIIAIAIVVVGTAVTIAVVFSGGNYNSWSGTMMSSSHSDSGWAITARTVNGRSTRTVDFDPGNLSALRIESINEGGSVYFTMTQGNVERVTDISGGFRDRIDTSGFDTGRIRLRLNFERASEVIVVVSWD